MEQSEFQRQLQSPPRAYSLTPFWFWNDQLSEAEILRQIGDFQDHGVHGFVIHPRVGLPRSIEFMSDEMLRFMDIAIREAQRREMHVILYDEGMYPSGSASGLVVERNPKLACRCLAMVELKQDEQLKLADDANLIAEPTTASGRRVAIIDRKAKSYIRGLHYIGDGPKEDEPPAGDILNPETTRTFIDIVHEKYRQAFAAHFGKTIIGIFTDEPNPLGKAREKAVRPGTTGIVEHVNRLLGYDFTLHLAALWFDDEPDAARYRRDYNWAIHRRLEETWYRPLSQWCDAHGIALCGHPDRGDEIGVQRLFTYPGQDLVWRSVVPDNKSALEGAEATQAKCTSSAMIHWGRKRNSNEFCGAYGHQTTFEEFKWLADWCLVRGVNLLIAHAFYYSIRGPRKDERPPQVGPNSKWWEKFKPFADHCTRLSWLNATSRHVCDIAILAASDHCPWPAAKACCERQRDFNYLDIAHVGREAVVGEGGVQIAQMKYPVLVVDGLGELSADATRQLEPMLKRGHVIHYQPKFNLPGAAEAADAGQLMAHLNALLPSDITLATPTPNLRVRHLVHEPAHHLYLLFNETKQPIETQLNVAARGRCAWIDPATAERTETPAHDIPLKLAAYQVSLLHVAAD